jgi:pyruvate kinase
MIMAGMNVARFNFSHGTHESNLKLVETVREAAQAADLPVALLLDLQGPKIRIGEIAAEGIELVEGAIVTLVSGATKSENGTIPIPYAGVGKTIQIGDLILLDDGTKELAVTAINGDTISAQVLLGGKLLSKKGLTIPRVSLANDAITAKDEDDLKFGLQHGMDFVALSFVRHADDVIKLKEKIAAYLPKDLPTPAVIVKIEKPEALDDFDAILAEADAVMIARGDLGLETPISRVPLHQKEIIHKCLAAAKPVITATEMLGTMQFNPRPTRAEVSDVANAVFDHTDAVMLSGETAMGRFPARAVRMMSDIIVATESSTLITPPHSTPSEASSPLAIADSVIILAHTLGAKAIVVTTQSGYFARAFARLRSALPILAVSPSSATYQQLLLSWGITPVLSDAQDSLEETLAAARVTLQDQHRVAPGDHILLVSSTNAARGQGDHTILLTRV